MEKIENIEILSENSKITRISMSKIMQNLVVLMDPSEAAWETSLKGGTMILNRFCIDEDAAFELSGVNYLKKLSSKMDMTISQFKEEPKGKELSFLRFYSICMNN